MHIHILGICGTFMGGIAAIAREAGHRVTGCDANVYPPMSDQLRELGIEARADSLAAIAPEHTAAIHAARDRLIGEGQMGLLFKVMGLAAPSWPDGAAF